MKKQCGAHRGNVLQRGQIRIIMSIHSQPVQHDVLCLGVGLPQRNCDARSCPTCYHSPYLLQRFAPYIRAVCRIQTVSSGGDLSAEAQRGQGRTMQRELRVQNVLGYPSMASIRSPRKIAPHVEAELPCSQSITDSISEII